jgi:hypothetical protein
MTKSAVEQGIKTPPTLSVLQGIVKGTEYAANVLTYDPDPDHAAIAENNFAQGELALILKLYGESIKQPLRLAIGKLSRTRLIFQMLTCSQSSKTRMAKGSHILSHRILKKNKPSLSGSTATMPKMRHTESLDIGAQSRRNLLAVM